MGMQVDELKKSIEDLKSKVSTNSKSAGEVAPATGITALIVAEDQNAQAVGLVKDSSNKFIADWIRKNSRDKVFLDGNCGAGERALMAAGAGAALAIGINTRESFVNRAKALARKNKLDSKTSFLPCPIEHTGLPSESIDVIVVDNFTDGIDLSFAFPEIRRILKPGGKLLFLGKLDFNPFVKLQEVVTQRKLTVGNLLKQQDVANFASNFFEVAGVHYWHLLTPSLSYFSRFNFKSRLFSLLNPVDKYLVKIPGLRHFSWQFSIEFKKKR